MSRQLHLGELDAAVSASIERHGKSGAEYPVHVVDPGGRELVPAAELLAKDRVVAWAYRAVGEWSDVPESENLRSAASRLMRRYCGSIAAGSLVALANGVAWDVSIPRIRLLIRDDLPRGVVIDLDGADIVTCPERPTTWPVVGRSVDTVDELREIAMRNLFGENFVPAFDAVINVVPLVASVLWGHAIELIDLFYDDAVESHSKDENELLAADREAVLFGERLPGVDGRNPMLGLMEWEEIDDPRFPRPVQLRQACCLNFLIPGRGSYCRSCARISADERLALWKAFADKKKSSL